MIKSRKDLKFYLQEDGWRNGVNYRTFSGRLKFYAKLMFGSESARAFNYLKYLRHYECYFNNSSSNIIFKIISFYYKIRLYKLGAKYHIQLLPNTCGYGLSIPHLSGGGGMLLNVKHLGNYCGVNSGVLLGNIDNQENRIIAGDFVAFGPGSKAFGKLTIGNNVFVAPNAVVTKDIPDNSIVAGVPARIIKEKQPPQILKNRDIILNSH